MVPCRSLAQHAYLHGGHYPKGNVDSAAQTRPLEEGCLGDVAAVSEENVGNGAICHVSHSGGTVFVAQEWLGYHWTDEGSDSITEEHQLQDREQID